MAKTEDEKMSRVHVHLFEDDWDFIKERFGPNIGAAKAIRTIVHRAVRKFQERIDSATGALPALTDESEA